MSRYKSAKYKIDKNGKRYFLPTIVPQIPLSDSDIFIRPVVGERFDSLAQKFYGDSSLWWIIAKANNLSNGSIVLDSEKKIRIPINIQVILSNLERS
jgi:hypothetical protein|tara:strand:+ start:3285 stop:3575 length:291 start_codon:yes stop_codon:yes gene_type:complete